MKLLLRKRRLPNSATGALMPACALRASAWQPSLTSLRKTVLACQAVAGEASEGWWRQSVTLRPRRSCKDHLHPCAVPDVAPCARFELACSVLQTAAITRFANRANFGAGAENRTPTSRVALLRSALELRPRRWWVTRESNTARAKAQALQTRSVTRLGVTRSGCGPATRTLLKRLMRPNRSPDLYPQK